MAVVHSDMFSVKVFIYNGHLTLKIILLQLGEASIEVTSLLREGESLVSASFFTKYDMYIDKYKDYSIALSEMEAVGGFEFAAKTGRYSNISVFVIIIYFNNNYS